MKTFCKLLGHPLFAFAILFGIGLIFLIAPIFLGGLGEEPWETLTQRSGQIGIWTLGAVLTLSPLRTFFPHAAIVAALNRHRRRIGVAACVYGVLHFTCHVIDKGDLRALGNSLSRPFTWLGIAGLTLLLLLATTSNAWATRKLGSKSWKRLHRHVYLAAILLMLHLTFAGRGHTNEARWWAGSLLVLEIARWGLIFARRKREKRILPTSNKR